MNFAKVLGWVINILPLIPSLVTDIERAFQTRRKAGPQKWIAVEQALSASIEDAANAIAKEAPAGTKPEEISAALAVFTKDVNDAFVKLANDLKLFQHGEPTPLQIAAQQGS